MSRGLCRVLLKLCGVRALHGHSAKAPSFHLSETLRGTLQVCVESERDKLKHNIKIPLGKRVLGEATVSTLLNGGEDIPAIYAQYTASELANAASRDVHDNQYSHALWSLLTKRCGSESEVSLFASHLEQRRDHFLSQRSGREKLQHASQALHNAFIGRGESVSVRRLLSFFLMHIQPESAFFLHRRETKKPFLHSLLIEDALDILAILPDLLALSNALYRSLASPSTVASERVLALAEGDSLMERVHFVATKCGPKEATHTPRDVEKKLVDELLRSFDGGNALIHVPRLVSCTLSDPFLATAAMLNAFPSHHKHNAHEKDEWTSATDGGVGHDSVVQIARITAGLVEVFWDRALMFPLENPKSLDMPSLFVSVA